MNIHFEYPPEYPLQKLHILFKKNGRQNASRANTIQTLSRSRSGGLQHATQLIPYACPQNRQK